LREPKTDPRVRLLAKVCQTPFEPSQPALQVMDLRELRFMLDLLGNRVDAMPKIGNLSRSQLAYRRLHPVERKSHRVVLPRRKIEAPHELRLRIERIPAALRVHRA